MRGAEQRAKSPNLSTAYHHAAKYYETRSRKTGEVAHL